MIREFSTNKMIAASLPAGCDLYQEITEIARQKGIRNAWVNVLGAVSRLVTWYYDQDRKEYLETCREEKLEILNCTGNLSIKENQPFAHIHITCAGREGHAVGGHLAPGTRVFAAEAAIFPLLGNDLVREKDEQTGLHLWK